MFFSKNNLEDRKIRRLKEEIEPQEILLDAISQKREEEVGFERIEVPLARKIPMILFFTFLVLIVLVLFRTFQFQVLDHKKFVALAQKNRFIASSVQAQRGVIYDRNFNQLVTNDSNFVLLCDKDKLKKRDLKMISWILKADPQDLEAKLKEAEEKNVVLAKKLELPTLILFESNLSELDACWIQNETIREYKEAPFFSHIIGYWRKSGKNAGLEAFYNDILSPRPGKILKERNAKGEIISEKVVSLPQPGKSLVLYLDSDLQKILTRELKKKLKEVGAKRAAAIALDPKTGGVLALVSLPSFDNNLFPLGISQKDWEKLLEDPSRPLLNRVIAGKYPTGSTIKPLIAAAALQERLISKNKTINCQGKIVIENPWFPDKPFIFRDWKIHGITDLKKAIAQSCNVYFYIIGGGYKKFKGLGIERIKKYLKLFGWGEVLGIDLPSEIAGFIPDKSWKKEKFKSPDNIWMPGDTYNLSIGQGYLGVTPLEVAASFVAIANKGKLFRPHLVQKIVDENKKVVKEIQPEIIREGFIDKENLEAVREGMREAVLSGTGQAFKDLPVSAATKTGTAQLSPTLTRKGYFHNWVTVFAPFEDPEIVLTIVVEKVKGMHLTAIPVAKEVLKQWFSNRLESSEK
jgi:penicillin-binding protein 2